MYDITVDRVRRRVTVIVAGRFELDEAAAFEEAVKVAALKAKAAGEHFDMLVDLSESALMTQAVSAESEALLAWCVENGMRRSANITTSALAKLQVRRVWATDRSRVCASRDEATAWLDEPS